jgi:apolipoprotein N-acyltransferase
MDLLLLCVSSQSPNKRVKEFFCFCFCFGFFFFFFICSFLSFHIVNLFDRARMNSCIE